MAKNREIPLSCGELEFIREDNKTADVPLANVYVNQNGCRTALSDMELVVFDVEEDEEDS